MFFFEDSKKKKKTPLQKCTARKLRLTAQILKSNAQSSVVFWILSLGAGCLGETFPEIRVSPRRFEALQLNMDRIGCMYRSDLFGDCKLITGSF